jgi:hypothetical protein
MTLPRDQVHSWIASVVDRSGGQLRAELEALVDQVQQAMDAHEAGRQRVTSAAGAPVPEPETLAAAIAAARIEEREADLATASAVLDAMTALDSANSLSDILDVLVDRAALRTGRVLLVIRRAGALTGWRSQGYAHDPRDAATLEIPLDDQGLVARAARTGATQTGRGPAAAGPGDELDAGSHAAMAVPLSVDGRVVAVLYAEDDGGRTDRAVPSPWPEVVEVLARHAARCLESMTARRVPELVRTLLSEPT